MNRIYGRSTLQIAEESLLELMIPVMGRTARWCYDSLYNREELYVGKKEMFKERRNEAESLFERWIGSKDDISQLRRIKRIRN